MRRETPAIVTGMLVTSTAAPLLAGPSLRSEQVSQLVLGEGAVVLETEGTMLRVRTALDGYEGWIAAGYGVRVASAEVEAWLEAASWSLGALLDTEGGIALRAPHRARLRVESDDSVRLPDGSGADVITGAVVPHAEMVRAARAESPAEWAWREFAGTPYLWGGLTGAGIDCSGLVQNTFLARGLTLPRDANDQARFGAVVDAGSRRAGDVLFFRAADGENIGHAAIFAGGDTIVHSAVDVGGVARESIAPATRAGALLPRLAAVRRFE